MFVGLKLGANEVTSAPSIKTCPSRGCSKPANNLNNVVLPQPEGPRREKNSPCFMENETSSTAFTSPKCFETFLISIKLSLMINPK